MRHGRGLDQGEVLPPALLGVYALAIHLRDAPNAILRLDLQHESGLGAHQRDIMLGRGLENRPAIVLGW